MLHQLPEGVPLVVFAGKEYGSGSSRDWAAKGTLLLGVRAVIAEVLERIHRSNLVGMGVLPLQFLDGETPARSASPDASVRRSAALPARAAPAVTRRRRRPMTARPARRSLARIHTPPEVDYFRHGGILPMVLRRMIAAAPKVD